MVSLIRLSLQSHAVTSVLEAEQAAIIMSHKITMVYRLERGNFEVLSLMKREMEREIKEMQVAGKDKEVRRFDGEVDEGGSRR